MSSVIGARGRIWVSSQSVTHSHSLEPYFPHFKKSFLSLQVLSLANKTQITLSSNIDSLVFGLFVVVFITLPFVFLRLLHLTSFSEGLLGIQLLLSLVTLFSTSLLKSFGVVFLCLLDLSLELNFCLVVLQELGHTFSLLLKSLLNQEIVSDLLLFLIFLGVHLVNTGPEVGRVTSESNIHQLQELVHTGYHGLRGSTEGFLGGLTVEEDDLVSEVSSHDEIVLDYKSGAFRGHDPSLHNSGSDDSLLGVEISGRLIN